MPRRFQFSLRALLVAMAVVSVLLAYSVQMARRRRATVEALESKGCDIGYFNDWILLGDLAPNAPRWLQETVGDEYFYVPAHIVLGASVTDDDVATLCKLKSLVLIVDPRGTLTDAHLARIKSELPDCDISIGDQ